MENTKISVKSLLMNEYASPYTLNDLYEYSKKFKCEELVDFVVAIYSYQSEYEVGVQTTEGGDDYDNEPIDICPIRDHKTKSSIVDKAMRFIKRLSSDVVYKPPPTDTVVTILKSESSTRRSFHYRMDEKLRYIINKFIRPKQINIPFHINDKLMKDYESNIRGPALFQESLNHCEMILKTSLLPGFTLERKQNPLVVT
jgi:hypothetical protein